MAELSVSTPEWRRLAASFVAVAGERTKCHLCELKERRKRGGEERRRAAVKKPSLRHGPAPQEEEDGELNDEKFTSALTDTIAKIVSPLLDSQHPKADTPKIEPEWDQPHTDSLDDGGILLLRNSVSCLEARDADPPVAPTKQPTEYTEGNHADLYSDWCSELDDRHMRLVEAAVPGPQIVAEANENAQRALQRFMNPPQPVPPPTHARTKYFGLKHPLVAVAKDIAATSAQAKVQ